MKKIIALLFILTSLAQAGRVDNCIAKINKFLDRAGGATRVVFPDGDALAETLRFDVDQLNKYFTVMDLILKEELNKLDPNSSSYIAKRSDAFSKVIAATRSRFKNEDGFSDYYLLAVVRLHSTYIEGSALPSVDMILRSGNLEIKTKLIQLGKYYSSLESYTAKDLIEFYTKLSNILYDKSIKFVEKELAPGQRQLDNFKRHAIVKHLINGLGIDLKSKLPKKLMSNSSIASRMGVQKLFSTILAWSVRGFFWLSNPSSVFIDSYVKYSEKRLIRKYQGQIYDNGTITEKMFQQMAQEDYWAITALRYQMRSNITATFTGLAITSYFFVKDTLDPTGENENNLEDFEAKIALGNLRVLLKQKLLAERALDSRDSNKMRALEKEVETILSGLSLNEVKKQISEINANQMTHDPNRQFDNNQPEKDIAGVVLDDSRDVLIGSIVQIKDEILEKNYPNLIGSKILTDFNEHFTTVLNDNQKPVPTQEIMSILNSGKEQEFIIEEFINYVETQYFSSSADKVESIAKSQGFSNKTIEGIVKYATSNYSFAQKEEFDKAIASMMGSDKDSYHKELYKIGVFSELVRVKLLTDNNRIKSLNAQNGDDKPIYLRQDIINELLINGDDHEDLLKLLDGMVK